MTRQIISVLLALVLCAASVFVFAGCDDAAPVDGESGNSGNQGGDNQGGNDNQSGDSDDDEFDEGVSADSRYTNYDLNTEYEKADAVKIEFTDSAATVTGEGAVADGTVVKITAPGTYILSGSSTDGRVIVEVTELEKVHLVFNGLKLVCTYSSPVYIKSCDKTAITLVEGTTNTLQDGGAYSDLNADGEPNACLFSKDDLTINGTGTLNVYANYNNGIVSKDDLKIISGTYNVTAKNHGIRGNDSVTIRDGVITISCKNDGIKSSNDTKEDKGYVFIEGGKFTVDAGDDVFQAPLDITITGGEFSVEAGGDVLNCDGTTNVADGLLK